MASIDKEKTSTNKWVARWREYPRGPQRTKRFSKKADAEQFLVKVQHEIATGVYVHHKAGTITLEDYATQWMGRRRWRPATIERVERDLRLHVLPAFGDRPLSSIKRAHVERWAAELTLAPATIGVVHATLSGLLEAAVEEGRLATNPARGATLPRVDVVPVVPLNLDEIHRLIQCAPPELHAAAVLDAGSGLRQGELAAVTVDRVDFLRRSLRIDRQVWTPRNGTPVLVAPKSARSFRTIALADVTVQALAQHVERYEPGPDGVLFHKRGRPWTRGQLAEAMRRMAKNADVNATWHSIRHHHASMLLSAGVSPALVAERLGHDIATLMRTYAHVIRSDDDRVRSLVQGALAGNADEFLTTRSLP